MLIKNTLTKTLLEQLIRNSFYTFGELSTSSLLDSLKLLGFNYATNAGLSINIEDLRIPKLKETLLVASTKYIEKVNNEWSYGDISETERFQTIINNWNLVTENLKTRLIEYYKEYDPLNNLYIMAFSGARGNIAQVRQLVGMRGLMADQEGNIIDLPIIKNFREGLSSLDYLISSYGARKGIVDTALKTADSGYLTRRLVYLCQDLIIREVNCKTQNGIIILHEKNKDLKNLLGRFLISYKLSLEKKVIPIHQIFTNELIKNFEKTSFYSLKIRSPLTCNLSDSVCQLCYGWNLSQTNLVSLGDTVGILAAQSIGEPGTQLTMRTFHTGGVFTSESLMQKKAPFSGKLVFTLNSNLVSIRTITGNSYYKTTKEIEALLIDWKGNCQKLLFPSGSILSIYKSCFVKKDFVLADLSTKYSLPSIKKLKPIFSNIEGQLKFDKLLVRSIDKQNGFSVAVTQEDSVLWLTKGQIFPILKEANLKIQKKLNLNKALAQLVLISPVSGFYNLNSNQISFDFNNSNFVLNLPILKKISKNLSVELLLLLKPNQYIDKHTVFAKVAISPSFNSNVYLIKQKSLKNRNFVFCITDDDVWKINSDEINLVNKKKNLFLKNINQLNPTIISHFSGFLLKKDGFRLIFQKAFPIFLNTGSLLNIKRDDFIFKNQIIANLITYTQQTQDIVQGLPKVEEIIEARSVNNKTILANKNGIFLGFHELTQLANYKLWIKSDKKILLKLEQNLIKNLKSLNKPPFIETIKNSLSLNCIVFFQNKLWLLSSINSIYKPIKSNKTGTHYKFIDKYKNVFNTKDGVKLWQQFFCNSLEKTKITFLTTNEYFIDTLNLKKSFFFTSKDQKDYFVFCTLKDEFLLLEEFNLITKKVNSLNYPVSLEKGQYIDIGEPFIEGIIDLHEFYKNLVQYQSDRDGYKQGFTNGLSKFQLILSNSIQAIYQSQGITINNKHIEIVVRQITSKVIVKESGNTGLKPGEIIKISLVKELWKVLEIHKQKFFFKSFKIEPILLSATTHSLLKKGFLNSAGFQETKRILTKAAIEGKTDWFTGVKESVILGRLISAGSSFLTYKQNLDTSYKFFKNKNYKN